MSYIETLRNGARNSTATRKDFDNNALENNDYLNLFGLARAQFDDLCAHIHPGSLRDTKLRSIRTCVGILLTKLKTGMSKNVLSTIFFLACEAEARHMYCFSGVVVVVGGENFFVFRSFSQKL